MFGIISVEKSSERERGGILPPASSLHRTPFRHTAFEANKLSFTIVAKSFHELLQLQPLLLGRSPKKGVYECF